MQLFASKIAAFIFLLIVSAPFLISLHFILQENLIQQEVEKKMSAGNLQSVRITKAKINWLKTGKEAMLDGRLFDVKYFEINENDIVTLTGLFDTEETNLLSNLKEYTEHSDNNCTDGDFAFKFLFSPLFDTRSKIALEASWLYTPTLYQVYVSRLPLAPHRSIIHPPLISELFSF